MSRQRGETNPIGLVEAHAHPILQPNLSSLCLFLLPFDLMHVPCYWL